MISSALLSFCIPTFNRADALKSCLQSIVGQDGFNDEVEVVIADNASTDHTAAVCAEFTSRYPNIKYFKNDVNVGMEKNFVVVLGLANGQVLKLLNDYSILLPDSLKFMLDTVKENLEKKPVLIYHNVDHKKAKLLCADFNPIMRAVSYWITWIGCFSIWKSDYDRLENKERFEGLLFYHLMVLIANFKDKRSAVVYQKKLLGQDTTNVSKGGYNFFKVFIENFIGKIVKGLYVDGEINYFTYVKVKSEFCAKFLAPWLSNIYLKREVSNFSSDDESKKIVFRYFKYNPAYYFVNAIIAAKMLKNKVIAK